MTAATCCARSSPRNVAPPLKSTRIRLRTSGECIVIMPSASVRRNSDLPEPVAPTHNPCGPTPFRAASLMSRYTGGPSSETPMGTGRMRPPLRRHRSSGSMRAGSSIPIRPSQSRVAGVGCDPSAVATAGRYGANRRAHIVACTSVNESGRPVASSLPSTPSIIRPSGAMRRRSRDAVALVCGVASTSTMVTPSPAPTWSAPVATPPSRITTTCPGDAPSGEVASFTAWLTLP